MVNADNADSRWQCDTSSRLVQEQGCVWARVRAPSGLLLAIVELTYLLDLSWMKISKVITKRSKEPTFEWKDSC